MNLLYFFSIAMAVVSNIIYHIAQKLTPGGVNPAVSLTVTYLVAAAGSLLLLVIFPLQTPLPAAVRQLNWGSYAVGISIIGLELGFLLAYRAGWQVSLVALVANTLVAVLLIPVGLILFREKLTLTNLLGIAFTVVGLVLINHR